MKHIFLAVKVWLLKVRKKLHLQTQFQVPYFLWLISFFSSFFHYSSCPAPLFCISLPLRPFRRSREPGGAWLSALRVAREKAMTAPLWLDGLKLERTSPWPSPLLNPPMSLTSTARSPLALPGLEMTPLCSKSSVSRPVVPFDFLYDTNMTFSKRPPPSPHFPISWRHKEFMSCFVTVTATRFMALIRSVCVHAYLNLEVS